MKNFYVVLLFILAACASDPYPKGHEEYVNKIEKNSAGDKQFSGAYHHFEFRATLLTREVSQAIHDRLKMYYDWSDSEAAEKLAERMTKLNDKSIVWMSFFTGDRKDDNLSTQNTIWKIYLEVGGQRYEGHATKINMNLSEALSIIPYHTRWATPYYLEFPVPTDQIVGQSKTLILTGPLGRREVHF